RLGERMNELSRGQYFRTAPRRERASTSTMKADRGAVSPLSRREARAARGCGSSLFLLLALRAPHRLRPPRPYTAWPPPFAAWDAGIPEMVADCARADTQGDGDGDETLAALVKAKGLVQPARRGSMTPLAAPDRTPGNPRAAQGLTNLPQ